MRRLIGGAALLAACLTASASAQEHDHSGHSMRAEEPPPATTYPPDPHAGHAPAEQVDMPHAGHGSPIKADGSLDGASPPLALPTDHAADTVYDPAAMARARAAMRRESGGMTFSQLMLDRLEYHMGRGADGYHWEGEGWIGGDINRFAVKSEGEGAFGGLLERAELQALYSRAIDPWFNLEAGIRQDFGATPDRTYAVVGVDGLAPYWFEVSAQAFLSTRGDAHLRLEGSYDQRITQRVILQPAAEVNIAAQDVPELGIGSGLSDVELGLRLRYEIAREFAPYVGVNWQRKLGDSVRFSRAQGDHPSATSLVLGVRFWF